MKLMVVFHLEIPIRKGGEIMKVHIVACLYPPHEFCGMASKRPVFSKEVDLEIVLTPLLLSALFENRFILEPNVNFRVDSYDEEKNVLCLTGYMDYLWEQQYLQLILSGWVGNKENLQRYGMYPPA